MKYRFIIIGILILSCKKGKDDNIPVNALRIKTVTNMNVVTTYTYDVQRRIIKIENETGFFKDVFTYEPGKINRVYSEPSNTVTMSYTLNASGYIQSLTYPGTNSITFYEYRTDGYRLRSYDDKIPLTELKYYYNASTGLLDSARSTTGAKWNYTNLFHFNTDRANTIADENFGQAFWGNLSPHPVKSIVTRKPDGNVVTVSFTNYAYTYDNKNRVASRMFTTSGGQTGTENYTYY